MEGMFDIAGHKIYRQVTSCHGYFMTGLFCSAFPLRTVMNNEHVQYLFSFVNPFTSPRPRCAQVWTWGKGDYFRLGHGTDQHVRRPSQVEALRSHKVVHVGVGALHCLAVTDTGQVGQTGQDGWGGDRTGRRPPLSGGDRHWTGGSDRTGRVGRGQDRWAPSTVWR